METADQRYILPMLDKKLPLIMETIGQKPDEEYFDRKKGYPHYHWLQTYQGSGELTLKGENIQLPTNYGVLFPPYMPHAYRPINGNWSTFYLTFDGKYAETIIMSLGISLGGLYYLNQGDAFRHFFTQVLENIGDEKEYSILDTSADIYRFLILLKKHGSIRRKPSVTNSFEKLKPLIEWLETAYVHNIGLYEMAGQVGISPQYLNTLFRNTFGTSPYSFLIRLRIRKSKELMSTDPNLPLKKVAKKVGFKDLSHFTSTFRKQEGITPAFFRNTQVTE